MFNSGLRKPDPYSHPSWDEGWVVDTQPKSQVDLQQPIIIVWEHTNPTPTQKAPEMDQTELETVIRNAWKALALVNQDSEEALLELIKDLMEELESHLTTNR